MPTWSDLLVGATAPPPIDGGRPARRAPRCASSVKGGRYPQGGSTLICSRPLARASRHSQRCGDQLHTRRLRTFCRPQREMRIRAQNSSMQALQQVVRLPLNTCGRGKISTAQIKRRRWRDPTPHRAGKCVLNAVQLVDLTTTRTRCAYGRCVVIVSGWGLLREIL